MKNRAKAIVATFWVISFMAGCAGPTTVRNTPNEAAVAIEAEKQKELAVKDLIKNQKRLDGVGWPLLTAGMPLCTDRQSWSIGLSYINKHNFPVEMQQAANSVYQLGDVLQVMQVIVNSPAQEQGIMEGDLLLAVNDKPAPVGKDAAQKMKDLLRAETKDGGPIRLKVTRNNIPENIDVQPVKICDYPLSIISDPAVNAFADGNQIVVNQGMMDFVNTDDELSIVVGHELAHNAMRHADAQRINALGGLLIDILFAGLGVNTQGAFSKAAAQAYSQEFEAEADYVGLYIEALAGKDISEAADFWRRIGAKNPGTIEKSFGASHPSTPERFVAIEDTIKEINQKKLAGAELMPNINEDARNKRQAPPKPESKLSFGPN